MRYRIFFFISILVYFSGCKTIEPEKPLAEYSTPVFIPKTSMINLGLELKESEMEKLINANTDQLLFEDNSFEDNGGDDLKMKAWKNGKIDVQFNGNQIIYKVPLKLWINAGFKVEQFGIAISNYKEVNAEMNLTFRTTFSIKEDWSLITVTSLEKYEWTKSPTVTVAGYDLPIKAIADMVLKSQKKTLGPLIDENFKSSFNVKKMAQDAWENIQKPTLLSSQYKLWLKVQPKEVDVTPPVTDKGVLKISLGITTLAETTMGAMPAFTVNKTLPKIKIVKQNSDQFVLNLYHEMSYPFLDSMARSLMVNQVFERGKKKVIVTGMNVYGNDNKMIVEAQLAGSVKGKVYLAGKPIYNKETKNIELSEVDFDIQSKNILLKSANWIYDGGFNKMIQERVKFPIGDSLEKQRVNIDKMLTESKIAPNVCLNGKINRLEVEDLWLTPGALKVYVGCEGQIHIKMVDSAKK